MMSTDIERQTSTSANTSASAPAERGDRATVLPFVTRQERERQSQRLRGAATLFTGEHDGDDPGPSAA